MVRQTKDAYNTMTSKTKVTYTLVKIVLFFITKNKYIIYNVHDYNVLYIKAIRPVICEGWYITRIRKTFT